MSEQILIILTIVFFSISGIQILFTGIIFGGFTFFHKSKEKVKNSDEGISVVIAAKNEYLNLKRFLPSILKQDYPKFEVIVVNNDSVDETEFLLMELKSTYPHLSYINVSGGINFFRGKKFPLSMGIKSAKYNKLLLTDADCFPCSENWIQEISNTYDTDTEIVIAYGAYKEKRGILNKLIRYETIRNAITYFAFAFWKLPYMGVGRNLSYSKALFYEQKGFMSHYNIPSGDDDLFVNKAANRRNTKIALNPDSKTISIPKQSFKQWFKQKRRHLSAGKKYKKIHILLLSSWELSTLFFYILAAILIALKVELLIITLLLITRLIVNIVVTKKFMKLVNERNLLLISPFLELILVVLNPIISIINIFFKQSKWK